MRCLRGRVICVLYLLGVLMCLACSRGLPAHMLGVLGGLLCSVNLSYLRACHKMACLACFSCFKNNVFVAPHKMACLKWLNWFLGVCDHVALVKCRFWMRSDVFNGRQEIAKPIIKIFVFVLNLNFLVWIFCTYL